MTIKKKLSILLSVLLTLLFSIASFIVIYMYSNFRKEEFKKRLEEKALTSVKLLIDVKEVDKTLLKIIDQNTVNKLYDEKTLIFDDKFKCLYKSLDDIKINWRIEDLVYLQKNKEFFRKEGENELLGVYYKTQGKSYFVLISASDTYGKRKVEFLIYLLVITSLFFSILGWILAFYSVRIMLEPLKLFHRKISKINANNLAQRVEITTESENEINLIGIEFNQMMGRIEDAYQKQRSFTAQASHELKTPIARIISQLENIMGEMSEIHQYKIQSVIQHSRELNELIESLLLLTKLENELFQRPEKTRIDEALDNSISRVCKMYPQFKIKYEIEESETIYAALEISINPILLEIVFSNLLKNAYLYSASKIVSIHLFYENNQLGISFENDSTTPMALDTESIFQPFIRGKNSNGISGLGLGLGITERIISSYKFSIHYEFIDSKHKFTLLF